MTATLTKHDCHTCQKKLALVTEYPKQAHGFWVAAFGFMLAPILIGIPFFFYGISLHGVKEQHFHCTGCGMILPVLSEE